MTQAPVPAFAFSTVVAGQADGQPAGLAGNDPAKIVGIGAGGAMSARLPVPDIIRKPVEAVAVIPSLMMPPYLDRTTPRIGIANRVPARMLGRVRGLQTA